MNRIFILLTAAVLVLAACAPQATPTAEAPTAVPPTAVPPTAGPPTEAYAAESAPTAEPTASGHETHVAAATGEPEAAGLVEAEAQDASSGVVVIKRVVSNGPGWMVVHNGVPLHPGIGHAPLVNGENLNVRVAIDLGLIVKSELQAMLHTDKGKVGVYDGFQVDHPVTGPNGDPKIGNIIVVPFEISFQPGVSVIDQPIGNGTLLIDRVIANAPGWLAIHSAAAGEPVIGNAPVEAGVNTEIVVEVDKAAITEVLTARLYEDAGSIGQFDGEDSPVLVGGEPVTASIRINVAPSVAAADQPIQYETVTVAQVIALQDGWLAIHSDAEGRPAIGFAPVKAGLNRGVICVLDPDGITDTLYATLHVDAGKIGEFEFPGTDEPILLNGTPVEVGFEVMK